MKTFKTVNNLMGWFIFAIAAFTYCSTIEPTASFWDCPEFISTAAKLEIGHPPGAPFFMLFGNFFSQFASDPSEIALMVNIMSALLSAGCILFLFWSITHLAKKLLCKDCEEVSMAKLITIMGCGIAGSLIYTWSDTFWFSAVEGEVYAFSSFMTALVFWLILKWENNADKPGSDRWLILIAYLVGLSIGVHLLNLLCISAIVLVFYYKKSKAPTARGSLLVLAVSAVIIAAVLYGIVPGIVKIAGWFELLFVNSFKMPYNTGLYIYLILLVGSLVWALYESTKAASKSRMNISFLIATALLGIPFYGHGVGCIIIGFIVLGVLAFLLYTNQKVTPRILNTALLCMTLMTVGYSSYAVIVIRSAANPPMDQNSPEDVFALSEYLGREQYGDRPLFMGQTYASQPKLVRKGEGIGYEIKHGASKYQRKDKVDESENDEYIKIREKLELVYPSNQTMLFPRIYSDEARHVTAYQQWLGNGPTKTVKYEIPGGSPQTVTIPTQWDNMRFFFSYQMNFMYWRYFMWNFAGRQNDIQSHGELEHGNWITGFDLFDNARLGDQSKLPTDLRENKGRNVFYCLPLILGLLGFFWQAFRDKKGIQQFWVVFFLFFMTGIAIVIYLNQVPLQPRERDYAYAGSFYAFAMWCGLGIAAIYEGLERFLGKKMDKRTAALLASVVAMIPAIAVPAQMVSQTWDDHDRSDRFVCRDFGLNYLETVPQDGVIFTNGDNDTFPLWYNEDVEEKRRDVRVCNLSYLQTDWYIDQMKRPAFGTAEKPESSPLPIHWKRFQYTSGKNEAIDVNPKIDFGGTDISMKEFVNLMYEKEPETAIKIWGDEPFELKNVIDKFVLKQGIPAEYADLVNSLPTCFPTDTVYINVDKEAVRRSGMMIPNDSIPDRMIISLKGQNELYKSFVMMLEMLAQINFSRPMYMSTTVGAQHYGSLYRHFLQEGIAYRITPFSFSENSDARLIEAVDTDKMYDNMMNKYSYGNMKQEGLYIDETTMRMCYTHRRWFSVLISKLVEEGKLDKAKLAAEKCETELPSYNIPHDGGTGSIEIASAFIACGEYDKGMNILEQTANKSREYSEWYLSLNNPRFAASARECLQDIRIMLNVHSIIQNTIKNPLIGDKVSAYESKAKDFELALTNIYESFSRRCTENGIRF